MAKKLAVSISGQTRFYGRHWKRFHEGLEDFFCEYEIDLFGHTWNNCEYSQSINTEQRKKFKSFEMSSNLEIWNEWVKYDIFRRTPFRESWNDDPDWQQFIRGNDSGIIEFIKQRSIGAWAQIWSFNKTLSQINSYGYDGLVRYRWDNYFTGIPEEMKTCQNIISDFFNKEKDFDSPFYVGGAECISMGPQLMTHKTMQDTFMIFNKEGLDKLMYASEDWKNTLEKTTYEDNENYHGPSSHELWATYLHACNKIIRCAALPNIRSTLESEDEGLIKENKKWDI